MKTLIITALIAIVAVSAQAQQKLPDTIRVKLSQSEYIAMMQKVDSLTTSLQATSSVPSNMVNAFNQRVQMAFSPLMRQVQAQLIADKPKDNKVQEVAEKGKTKSN